VHQVRWDKSDAEPAESFIFLCLSSFCYLSLSELFNDAFSIEITDELRELEGFVKNSCVLIEALFHHLPGGNEENHETSVRTAHVPAKIRTEHLPNTDLERYF
jgi:hypothetical protein